MDEQTYLYAQRIYFSQQRKMCEIMNTWKDGTLVQKLEELAHDDRYAAWASPFADSAKRYFCSDEWTTLFSKIENTDSASITQHFVSYNSLLLQLLLDQSEQTKSPDYSILITLDNGILNYIGKLTSTKAMESLMEEERRIMDELFDEALELRTSQSSEADLYHSLTLAEFRSIATAITYSLPIYKHLFNDIQVSLEQKGCKVYFASTPLPLENQKK